MADTVTLGRSKRATAGNRMRELLEKAHQEDEDELFREVEDDEEFAAPQEARDVFLEDFADTDDEVEMDEEEMERQMRREERRKAKGKGKGIYDPFGPKSSTSLKHKPILTTTSSPNTMTMEEELSLLDPDLDTSNMAPSTLILTLRNKRREAMRSNRSEARRSNLRASTLKTEEEVIAREAEAKENLENWRKSRKMPDLNEIRASRKMTQAEMIAEALEEEERNKESLRDWLAKEEKRRELRRVGRKRVRGPRWTWISRTVGKMVEIVENETLQVPTRARTTSPSQTANTDDPLPTASQPTVTQNQDKGSLQSPTRDGSQPSGPEPVSVIQLNIAPSIEAGPSRPQPLITEKTTDTPDGPSQYTRNYLILSEIAGGLPSELAIILGEHTEWDQLQYIPARNRPLNRRPTTCPFTGLPAKYKHPATGIPYASVEGYKIVEGLVENRYVYDEDMGWVGAEEEDAADGVEEVEGWMESIWDGWMAGKRLQEEEDVDIIDVADEEEVAGEEVEGEEEEAEEEEGEEAVVPNSTNKKRKGSTTKGKKGKKSKSVSSGAKKVKKR